MYSGMKLPESYTKHRSMCTKWSVFAFRRQKPVAVRRLRMSWMSGWVDELLGKLQLSPGKAFAPGAQVWPGALLLCSTIQCLMLDNFSISRLCLLLDMLARDVRLTVTCWFHMHYNIAIIQQTLTLLLVSKLGDSRAILSRRVLVDSVDILHVIFDGVCNWVHCFVSCALMCIAVTELRVCI